MKTKLITLILMFLFGTGIIAQKTMAQDNVSFQVFYDELSSYGTWINNVDYGYVWVPNVDANFTPYSTNGYWVFTEDGWTWVSNYPWGWAPFHYGRWHFDNNYGYIWVPENEWGPGWVTWRQSDSYYGWAPMEPGISLSVAYGNSYYVPNDRWTFVRNRDFGRRDINIYYVNNSSNVTIINHSRAINNTRVDRRNVSYNTGPKRTEVEHRAGRSFAPIAIRENNKPGQNINNSELHLYRPQVQRNNTSAPARVSNMQDIKTTQQRKAEPVLQNGNNPTAQPQRSAQPLTQGGKVVPQRTPPVTNQQPNPISPSQRAAPVTNTQPKPIQQAPAPQRVTTQPQSQPQRSAQPVNQGGNVEPQRTSPIINQQPKPATSIQRTAPATNMQPQSTQQAPAPQRVTPQPQSQPQPQRSIQPSPQPQQQRAQPPARVAPPQQHNNAPQQRPVQKQPNQR